VANQTTEKPTRPRADPVATAMPLVVQPPDTASSIDGDTPSGSGKDKAKRRKHADWPTGPAAFDLWRAKPELKLSRLDAGATPGVPGDRDKTEKVTSALRDRLRELQGALHGEKRHAVLVVLQAMDTGGKDGTVKSLYLGMNPTAAAVHSFAVPTEEELAHDFLWRIHARTPRKGDIGVFNRSHYEDVLAVRVRNIAPRSIWFPRFEAINHFEAGLHASGTTIVKIMLHISKEEQQARLQARIDRVDKRWKFRAGDLEDRELWTDYQRAYEDAIHRTSTDAAPWYVVPADKKWYRDFATLTILVNTLEALRPAYPPRRELDGIVVK
jgi:PPK2 family polyphosphate:nucleotide phosphotransferase